MEVGQLGRNKKILITPEGMSVLLNEFDDLFGDGYEITFTNGIVTENSKLEELLQDKDACIIGSEKLDYDLLSRCKNLKIISRFGSGYDSISLKDIHNLGISLSISPSISVRSVARHTLALFMSLTHNILLQKRSSYTNKWDRTLNLAPEYIKVGLIGSGPIAQQFAKYLVNLEYKVFYYSRSKKESMESVGVKYCDSIDELLQKSDVVSLHLKLVDSTKKIAGKDFFKKMKGGFFINTARGGLVDEVELYNALDSGMIAGAALDVYQNEPATGISNKIRKMENVVSTCHVSSYDQHSLTCVGKESISNITHYFNNNPKNLINIIN
jgi:D-3-phosphoglycerate dehydrogenase / 2-oxoglutarate reductase